MSEQGTTREDDTDHAANPASWRPPTPPNRTWRRTISPYLLVALLGIATVWLVGAVWSFSEQTNYALSKKFDIPELLPLVLDGLAFSMAAVAWAATLDGRGASFARMGTLVAIGASAASNGAYAWERSGADPGTVALAVAVPLASNLALEVLLAEVRRQVQTVRGRGAPVPIPSPRMLRVLLAPWSTMRIWRRLVLAATDPRISFESIAVVSGGGLAAAIGAASGSAGLAVAGRQEVRQDVTTVAEVGPPAGGRQPRQPAAERMSMVRRGWRSQAARRSARTSPPWRRSGRQLAAANPAKPNLETVASGVESLPPGVVSMRLAEVGPPAGGRQPRQPAAANPAKPKAPKAPKARLSTSARVAEMARRHPTWTNRQVADAAGTSVRSVERYRPDAGGRMVG